MDSPLVRRYARIVALEDPPSTGLIQNRISALRKRSTYRRSLRDRVEAFAWVAAAVFTVLFGDGSSDMTTLVLSRRIKRAYLVVAFVSSLAYLGVLFYLMVCIKFHKRGDSWQKDAPWAVPVATFAGLTSFLGFGISLWPVYGWLTPVVEV